MRLTEGDKTMQELLEVDVTTRDVVKCCAIKKHGQEKVTCGMPASLALLACNNHYKAYGKWGDVPL